MILKKCLYGSMTLIDGINEAHVYEHEGIYWIKVQRGKETETHRLDEQAYLLNDEGKTIERLPYRKPNNNCNAKMFEEWANHFNKSFNTKVAVDGEAIGKAVSDGFRSAIKRSSIIV